MNEPLAQRLRPKTLADVCGQQHLLAPGRVFRRTIETAPPAPERPRWHALLLRTAA